MSIPREEHDAKIGALEARIDGRMKEIESGLQSMRQDFREFRNEIRSSVLEFRKELRESMRLAMVMFVTILVAIVSTGITTAVALHQSMASSVDNLLAAFDTGKSMQPSIHVIPHAISPVHERQAAAAPVGQRGEHNE
ncbi:hypothetical protein LK996_01280 [Lysobacter sp. A6]|uniref:Uncharacterized protein n=1 Tax=Noviluteimonas lactosilytica TaxID=2888523 RepID=A0ABS8JDN0_9GAMM|nr:hypothetical protein [Lysobacter lactosilyticus]MCC8361715.1 hypothetical protein [Lysobacter lactosilyticus]